MLAGMTIGARTAAGMSLPVAVLGGHCVYVSIH